MSGVVVGVVFAVVSISPVSAGRSGPAVHRHSAGDYLAAALLFIAAVRASSTGSDTGLTAFYVAGGVAVLAVS